MTKAKLPSLSLLMATRRWCYTIPIGQDINDHGGYVPSVAVENESGHYPMIGGAGKAPWVWGKDLAAAEATAAELNAKMGIDPGTAMKIVATTFAPH